MESGRFLIVEAASNPNNDIYHDVWTRFCEITVAYNYGRMPSRKIPEPGNNREKNTKMIDGIYDVAFRCTRDDGWEAYALPHSAYGFGDNLAEARKDITEALALLVEQPENRIRLNEYHERLILAADEHHADVWLRAHHETDPNHALSRREIVGKLQNEPGKCGIFDNGLSLNGDIIVLACLPDDILGDVFTQVASAHRLYLAVAYPEGLCLRRMHTNEATDRTPESEINIASLNLGAGSTVDDFIRVTSADHNHDVTREEYLVA